MRRRHAALLARGVTSSQRLLLFEGLLFRQGGRFAAKRQLFRHLLLHPHVRRGLSLGFSLSLLHGFVCSRRSGNCRSNLGARYKGPTARTC